MTSVRVRQADPAQANTREVLALVLITAGALLLRAWAIGAKGLWYDEAVTSFFARAPLADMIAFHWKAPFEHAPTWMVLEHVWTGWFGQGEAALRWPSALAGAALPWATWLLARQIWPEARIARLTAAGLVALSPMLIQFSQEARMYALASLLAIISLYLLVRFLQTGRPVLLLGLVLANWGMTALQYYYGLLFLVEGLVAVTAIRSHARRALAVIAALALSAVPAVLWVVLSPNFRTTAGAVLGRSTPALARGPAYFARVWRDLTFGAPSFQPSQAALGYLLVPLVLGGLLVLLATGRRGKERAGTSTALAGVLFLASLVLPPIVTGEITAQGYSRWFLYAVPLLCILVGLAVEIVWRWHTWAGVLALVIALGVFVWGDRYYYLFYEKSQYREAAAEVAANAQPGDALILEAPRQHLLAKYYMPALPTYPIPQVELPANWPVNAPTVVPEREDGSLQAVLAAHDRAWLVLAGEDEVDPGEFVHRYLTAIVYEAGCRRYLDVELCQFVAPRVWPGTATGASPVRFGENLELEKASLSLRPRQSALDIPVQLDWRLLAAPAPDYIITLRLVDQTGRVAAQLDRRPIGDLLPSSTWGAGDEKPGYFVLQTPDIAAGDYQLQVGAYDAGSRQLAAVTSEGQVHEDLVTIACLKSSNGQVKITPCATGR